MMWSAGVPPHTHLPTHCWNDLLTNVARAPPPQHRTMETYERRELLGCGSAGGVWVAAPRAVLGYAESSRGDAESSLGDAESSRGDAKISLGDAESSLGDAKSSLGDAESSLGDATLDERVAVRVRAAPHNPISSLRGAVHEC
jgi:hypothetical protein